MRKAFIAIAFALTSGSAFAADMPPPVYKAPLPPAPTWTGCYISGGVGYGMWDQQHYAEEIGSLTVLSPTMNTGGEGWLGRVGAGCDYQVSSRWLIGVFGDYDFASLSGSFEDPWTPGFGTEKETGAWAVGGRIGYLVTPKFLTYFDGGYTEAQFNQINLSRSNFASPLVIYAPFGYIPAHTYGGFFIGGGTEYALDDIFGYVVPLHGLFWRTEYRYSDYQAADLPLLGNAGGPLIPDCEATCIGALGAHMQKNVQTITSSLVWRFNWFGAQ